MVKLKCVLLENILDQDNKFSRKECEYYTKYFRIIDFGLAKELGGPEKERCGMDGTLEFMAPEVIRWIHVLFSVR